MRKLERGGAIIINKTVKLKVVDPPGCGKPTLALCMTARTLALYMYYYSDLVYLTVFTQIQHAPNPQ